MNKTISLLGGLFFCLFSVQGFADAAADAKAEAAIRAQMQQLDHSIQISDVTPTPLAGIYLVTIGKSDLLYVSADGNYVLQGDLLSVGGNQVVNLTDAVRSQINAELLDGFARDKQIVFAAEGEQKASITVFTDVDCTYCRKLHSEVPQLNAMGIEVRYMAFPRGGKNSPAYAVMQSVWCADDPLQAMTDAKSGKDVADKSCDNPVQEEYELGIQLGIRGTPALFLDDGTMIPGYRPAEALAQDLGIL
ncbi:thioredoxin fold domain-containing protein [Aestuariirhabdus sp. LZHN29]|uniref:thioredoxin fold domain-containing protein n=1 Tax=Aestuariirhabdus sp. LZHN29 TaxID=3417462 RepID=UPI003CF34D7D